MSCLNNTLEITRCFLLKKVVALLCSVALILGFSSTSADVVTAKTKIIKHANCKALNQVYKGGVARSASVKNKGGKTKYKPFVSKELYNANVKSDRDKDFIACER
jgi:hypothetical protein